MHGPYRTSVLEQRGGSLAGLSRRSFLRLMACMGIANVKISQGAPSRADQAEVVHTRVFAATPNGGSPCPVITFADQLTDAQMQGLAQKFGLDTAFILKPRAKSGDIRIRYFVPDHEMGVSGHATIAAITVARLVKTLSTDYVRVETITGVFEAQSVQSRSGILVTLEQNPPVFGVKAPPELVARALKIDPDKIIQDSSPIQSVSVSRAKLVVPLPDSIVLNSLTPDYEALWNLCEKLEVTGLYPFTRQTDKPRAHVEARQFPLRAGFPEDPATGVAAGALGAYLAVYDHQSRAGQHLFRIAQGFAMGVPSLIEAIAECAEGKVTRTAIRGMAQVVRREPIAF